MNKVFLIGNLTKDPELTTTTNGVNVCKFSLAVNRNFKNAEGERETDFINIVVWRVLGENCVKFLNKGNKAAVCGSIVTRSYETDKGEKRYLTEVVADEVEFLTSKKQTAGDPVGDPGEKKGKSETKPVELVDVTEESLPF